MGLNNGSGSADQVEIDRRVNEGVTDLLLRTGCKVTSATMSETNGSGDYTLDTAIMDVKAWTFAGTSATVVPERVSIDELLALRAASTTSTTSGSPAQVYAVAGANMLMVWPTPSAADVITVYYVPRPTTLTTGANTPSEIPAEFHPAVELYALWRLASMTDDQSSSQGERYRILYEGEDGKGGWVARVRGHVNKKGGRLGRAQVGPRPRRYTAANDVYGSGW